MGLSDSRQGRLAVMSSRPALLACARRRAGSPRLLDRSFHARCPQPPRKARQVHLPVATPPAFSGFILRGGLAAFDLLTRPNRVHFRYGSRVRLPSSHQFHYWNPLPFGYMLNRQLHDELLAVHKIGQAFPGTPRVSKWALAGFGIFAPESNYAFSRTAPRKSGPAGSLRGWLRFQ